MLFSVMFFMESEAKVASKERGENKVDHKTIIARAKCADAMLVAARTMGKHRSTLWQRGVPDDAVVGLPCRIAYQMLELATGVVARKAASADAAMGMIVATVDSATSLLGTVVAALMDLLHSYEHIAPIVAEMCAMVSEEPTNRLAVELLREIGRLDGHASAVGDGGKASGIRNVAPFISELANERPRIVLSNISVLLPHLNSEPYALRSAIVNAIGVILVFIGKQESERNDDEQVEHAEESEGVVGRQSLAKSRTALLDILAERIHDVSSFTRVAVLKAWISITQSGSLPLERLKVVSSLAIDRLQDKTVMVRRSAMQVG